MIASFFIQHSPVHGEWGTSPDVARSNAGTITGIIMVEGQHGAPTRRAKARKPTRIEVHVEAGSRFIVATFGDGEVVRKLVDPNKKLKRKPRRPYARAYSEKIDRTRKKRF
jgi:hypothetical protein